MSVAARGDTTSLERLLASPKAAQMRAAVAEWVLTHPTPTPTTPGLRALRPVGDPLYSGYSCTGYNGLRWPWNGKIFHACHGYLDKYVNSSVVKHVLPDVYPPGNPVSVARAHAWIGLSVLLLGALPVGPPTGGLGWVGAGVGVGWAMEEVWISCGRVY